MTCCRGSSCRGLKEGRSRSSAVCTALALSLALDQLLQTPLLKTPRIAGATLEAYGLAELRHALDFGIDVLAVDAVAEANLRNAASNH